MISDECAGVGYVLNAGDIGGSGQISGQHTENSISGCAARCDGNSECGSFEYSSSTKKCNLNTDISPDSDIYGDYSFCVKGMYEKNVCS